MNVVVLGPTVFLLIDDVPGFIKRLVVLFQGSFYSGDVLQGSKSNLALLVSGELFDFRAAIIVLVVYSKSDFLVHLWLSVSS